MNNNKENFRTRVWSKTSSAIEKAGDITTSKIGEAAETTKEVSSKVVLSTGNIQSSLKESTINTVERLQSAKGSFVDLITKECSVPVFLIPVSSAPDDFHIVFEFEDAIDALKSGIFVRPVLEVWAGRNDFDRQTLTNRFRSEFIRQFDEAKEKNGGSIKERLELITEEQEQVKERSLGNISKLAGMVTASIVLILLLNPIFDLLLLAVALYGAGSMSKNAFKYFRLSGESKNQQRELEKELHELESKLDSKNKAFGRAITNLRINIHPQLQMLTQLLYEVEGVVFMSVETNFAENYPEIDQHIRSSDYLNKLREEYQPLLDLF